MFRLIVACAVVLAAPLAAAAPSFTAEVTGKGRAVLLIPGLGCPGSVWTQTAVYLGKNHEVHTLSLAGFAGAKPIRRPIPSAVKDDVIAYIKEHALEKPVIVGHSMGGFVALWIAQAAPELVGPVIVVDSGPTLGGGDPDMIPYAKAKRDAYKTMTPQRFESTIRERFSPMFSDPKKREHEAILAAVVRSDQKAYADALYQISTVDLRPNLAKLAAPTLLILADGPVVKRIRAQMKPAKHHEIVVLKTRHFVMHDDFAGFSKAVDAFLTAH
jgi:pimeloyl-ACP methyl ester carboxylesterase